MIFQSLSIPELNIVAFDLFFEKSQECVCVISR